MEIRSCMVWLQAVLSVDLPYAEPQALASHPPPPPRLPASLPAWSPSDLPHRPLPTLIKHFGVSDKNTDEPLKLHTFPAERWEPTLRCKSLRRDSVWFPQQAVW